MCPTVKKILPWIALGAILVAALLIVLGSNQRVSGLAESRETRAAAEQVLSNLQAAAPASLEAAAFRSAIEQAGQTPYIAAIWLFDTQGKMVYAEGSPRTQGNAAEDATLPVKQALASLPAEALTPQQRTLLLVSSTVQAEGEHADVFRYRAQPVVTASGETIGFLALAYDVSPAISAAPGIGEIAAILGGVAALGIYWLALPAWVYLDARPRGERAGVWAIFVLIGNLVALIAYLLTRQPVEA